MNRPLRSPQSSQCFAQLRKEQLVLPILSKSDMPLCPATTRKAQEPCRNILARLKILGEC